MKQAARFLSVAACLWGVSAVAQAQGWPAAPVRLVVPFTAGSATDIMARTVGERLSHAFGQPVVVDNRPGAGGTIGAATVAKAAPDGYTLLVVSTGHVVNPVLYPDLTYDTIKDFAGVAPLASLPSVLAVSPSLGYKSVRDLVAAAKAKPGEFNYGTAGVGSAAHINSEKFRDAADIKAQHIPFKGTPEMLNETMAGRIQFIWAPLISSLGADQGRQADRARRQHADALAGTAGCAHHSRGRLPCRGIQFLDRHAGAGSHAARHRRQAQRRDQPRAADAGGEGTPCQHGRRADVDVAGAVRRIPSRRGGSARQCHAAGRRQGQLISGAAICGL